MDKEYDLDDLKAQGRSTCSPEAKHVMRGLSFPPGKREGIEKGEEPKREAIDQEREAEMQWMREKLAALSSQEKET